VKCKHVTHRTSVVVVPSR